MNFSFVVKNKLRQGVIKNKHFGHAGELPSLKKSERLFQLAVFDELVAFPDFGFFDGLDEVVEAGYLFFQLGWELVDGVAGRLVLVVDVEYCDPDYGQDDFGFVVEENAHAAVVEDVADAEFLFLSCCLGHFDRWV